MTDLLDSLRADTPAMVATLQRLVDQESPSSELDLLEDCARLVAQTFEEVLGSPAEIVRAGGKPHVRWVRGEPKVLLLGHFDTVWPRGTVARWPFGVKGDTATGPGAFDMKAGLVQALYAIRALGAPEGVLILMTSDEEVGSTASRGLIEESARQVAAALVLEPSLDGALKIARKGVAGYKITVHGLAAHASQPGAGVNATLEMAHVAIAAAALADDEVGTTVSPTVVQGGTVTNTIPAQAVLSIDSRAPSVAEQERVDAAIHGLQPVLPGAELEVEGGPNRAPMSEDATRDLYQRAQEHAADLGLEPLLGAQAPGGSDGQLTAAVGTPTLDGLGAVGGNMHAEGEFLVVSKMAERAAVVAALVRDFL